MKAALPVFIGYDAGEPVTYDVCKFSLERRTTIPLNVKPLDCRVLHRAGLYDRPWHQDGNKMVDDRDGKPFSTEFSFTRFLVPALNLYDGWALFCDGDFLYLQDVAKLTELADDKFAVMCVQHSHDPVETTKMDGRAQTRYRRKNWSSLVLWNCAHPLNAAITPRVVNHEPGQWLHAFSWLKDEHIGALPLAWNWLSGVSAPLGKVPSAVHFTLGSAEYQGHEHDPYADLWLAEHEAFKAHQRLKHRAA